MVPGSACGGPDCGQAGFLNVLDLAMRHFVQRLMSQIGDEQPILVVIANGTDAAHS